MSYVCIQNTPHCAVCFAKKEKLKSDRLARRGAAHFLKARLDEYLECKTHPKKCCHSQGWAAVVVLSDFGSTNVGNMLAPEPIPISTLESGFLIQGGERGWCWSC